MVTLLPEVIDDYSFSNILFQHSLPIQFQNCLFAEMVGKQLYSVYWRMLVQRDRTIQRTNKVGL